MDDDYQRFHETADKAAAYAEKVPGWDGMSITKQSDGRYYLNLEWREEKNYVGKRKTEADDK